MDREGENEEKMRKCREWISLHFLILSPFPFQFLILSQFPLHFLILSIFSQPGWQACTTCAALWRVVPKKLTKQTLHLCTLRGAPVVYMRAFVYLWSSFVLPWTGWSAFWLLIEPCKCNLSLTRQTMKRLENLSGKTVKPFLVTELEMPRCTKDTINCPEKLMKISHFNQTNQRLLSILW